MDGLQNGDRMKTGRREEEAHGGEEEEGGEEEGRGSAAVPGQCRLSASRPLSRVVAGRWPAACVLFVRRRRRCRPCHFVCHVVSFATKLQRNLLHATKLQRNLS